MALRFKTLGLIFSGLIIAGFLLAPPVSVLDKAHAVGYAICHQLPARTFKIEGVPLPLCARCTGIYLGFLGGLLGMWLLRRQYAIDLPPTAILVTLVLFILVMIFDGLNSFLEFVPAVPQLYPSQNWLRLTTGTLHGLALSVIVYPVVSISLWRPELVKNEAIIQNVAELAAFVAGGGAIIAVVLWQNSWLLYPLTILSALGVVVMLTMVNTVLVLALTRREAAAGNWRELVAPVTMAAAISFLMIGGMDWLRLVITRAAHLPF